MTNSTCQLASVNPNTNPNESTPVELTQAATFTRRLWTSTLRTCQFLPTLTEPTEPSASLPLGKPSRITNKAQLTPPDADDTTSRHQQPQGLRRSRDSHPLRQDPQGPRLRPSWPSQPRSSATWSWEKSPPSGRAPCFVLMRGPSAWGSAAMSRTTPSFTPVARASPLATR